MHIFGDVYYFQQDNASVHVSKDANKYFEEKNIKLLKWPVKSPDLNPIENLWGLMARKVYENGRRQFANKKSLIQAIKDTWAEIGLETVQSLVKSMPDRCAEVLLNRGHKIDF